MLAGPSAVMHVRSLETNFVAQDVSKLVLVYVMSSYEACLEKLKSCALGRATCWSFSCPYGIVLVGVCMRRIRSSSKRYARGFRAALDA